MTSPTKRTPIFDTVRKMLGRGFKQHEVDALDGALDQALGSEENSGQDSGPSGPCLCPTAIGSAGIALIKQFEGCARLRTDGLVEAYPDPGTGGDPWTIGWGATGRGLDGMGRIGPGTVWTRAQCDARLESDLVRYADDVARALDGCATTQNQFDALVSFHYNTGAIGRATLSKCHKQGDYAGALREFARWNRAGGRVLKGLTRRRTAEAALYGAAA
ncbi:lysozyme [Pontixanthobacter aquaemixtae]|uniref:Lysozyme n=1 Tax=Pontixanthobacter aquaemixtae TaxID=1958940 RepID=A0A844ZP45_9SPHN|nr:lysozyme [Pontixanthobacter aquaemixtae]MXO89518.1 glycoside hydrolase family protein [Pontixanthobacter aquaemixtae]